MIDCWKKNKYLYSDLEEMYLVNMKDTRDRELLARELGKTIGDNRYRGRYRGNQNTLEYIVLLFSLITKYR